MSDLEVALAGKSLADYTKSKLMTALGTPTYTSVGDMWYKYLKGLNYTGSFTDMLQQFYVANSVPYWARNPYNAAVYISTGDPEFSSVVSLLHFDGEDGSTTFTDVKGHSWTATGDAQLDTAQYKFGSASAYFDGTGDYISVTSDDLILGTGDFTIEAWLRRGVSATQNIISWSGNNAIYMSTGQNNIFVQIGGVLQTTTAAAGLNTWFHVALCRNAGVLNVFVDGVKDSETPTNTTNFTTGLFEIGRRSGSANMFSGWVDEFRVTKGIARYTDTFTPQTSAFPDS